MSLIDASTPDDDLRRSLRAFLSRRLESAAVDDVLQDVLLRMHRGLGALRAEERLGPWLYRVARNAVSDHRRDLARHRWVDADAGELAGAAPEPEQTSLEAACASSLLHMVAKLPSPFRETLTLTELRGLTQSAAAHRLGISLSATKSRVQRGRAHLRDAFEKCCAVELDARGRIIDCERRAPRCG